MQISMILNLLKFLPHALVLGALVFYYNAHGKLKAENQMLVYKMAAAEKAEMVRVKHLQDLSDARLELHQKAWTIDYEKIKSLYQKALKTNTLLLNNQKSIINGNVDLTMRLREAVRKSQHSAADIQENTSDDAESLRKRNRAITEQYEVLRLACMDTTSQFNQCRVILDEHCSIVDCVR